MTGRGTLTSRSTATIQDIATIIWSSTTCNRATINGRATSSCRSAATPIRGETTSADVLRHFPSSGNLTAAIIDDVGGIAMASDHTSGVVPPADIWNTTCCTLVAPTLGNVRSQSCRKQEVVSSGIINTRCNSVSGRNRARIVHHSGSAHHKHITTDLAVDKNGPRRLVAVVKESAIKPRRVAHRARWAPATLV